MTRGSPEVVAYPRDEFAAEYRRVYERGGFDNQAGRQVTQVKYVFPAFTEGNTALKYNVDSAIVLRSAGVRNDLSAIWHQITLKGYGAPQRAQQPRQNVAAETSELLLEQIGLGGVNGMIRAAMNRYRYHIDAAVQHRIALHTNDETYGTIDVSTALLHDECHLPGNGFPLEGFDVPSDATGVLLSKIRTKISRKQRDLLQQNQRHVNWRYDKAPRLIQRMHLPDSLFDNWGTEPEMYGFVRYSSSDEPEPELHSFQVPIPPVERRAGTLQ